MKLAQLLNSIELWVKYLLKRGKRYNRLKNGGSFYDRGNSLLYTFMIKVLPDTFSIFLEYVLVITKCGSEMICETQKMFALLHLKVTWQNFPSFSCFAISFMSLMGL